MGKSFAVSEEALIDDNDFELHKNPPSSHGANE